MNPFGYLPILAQLHQQELRKEAEQYRMLNEAFRDNKNTKPSISRFIAWLGKELDCLGFSREVRYGGQPETITMFTQQSNPGDCA